MAHLSERTDIRERRRYMRFPLSYLVSVTHDGATTAAHLRDMSLSGLFVETMFRIPINDPVEVTIYDHDRPAESCSLRGTVVRCNASGIGIKLDKMLLQA